MDSTEREQLGSGFKEVDGGNIAEGRLLKRDPTFF